MTDKIFTGDGREVLAGWPAGCVDMVVTSPPYWGLRDYGVEGQLGSEDTLEEYIDNQVAVFREVRRVLKDHGTLWINMGDSYATGGRGGGAPDCKQKTNRGSLLGAKRPSDGLKPHDMVGQPWRLALALQADGWYLRSAIIWAKAVSFCDTYSGSTMPESVNGWRWERCRRKVKAGSVYRMGDPSKSGHRSSGATDHTINKSAQWEDCPGCEKCEGTDGYVLRKGAWRPTKGHEHLFLFAKSERYYCDAEAVKEAGASGPSDIKKMIEGKDRIGGRHKNLADELNAASAATRIGQKRAVGQAGTRNLRDVWTINPSPTDWEYCSACDRLYGLSGYRRLKTSVPAGSSVPIRHCSCGRSDSWVQHFATFPRALVEPCIKAGTSERGNCPKCGMPWVRVIESEPVKRYRRNDRTDRHNAGDDVNSCGNTVAGVSSRTIAWRPSCECKGADGEVLRASKALVLDPYMGSGTTALAAYRLGRDYVGIELNPDYAAMARKRLAAAGEQYGLLDSLTAETAESAEKRE